MDSKTVFEQIKNSRLKVVEDPKKHVKIKNLKYITIDGYPAITAKIKVYGKDKVDGKQMYYAIYRAVLAKKRIYEIFIVNREEFPSDKMITLFMDSFEIGK